MPRLQAQTRTIGAIPQPLRDEMFQLYTHYYDATDRILFENDLEQKDRAVLLWNDAGRLRGFSTLAQGHHRIDGREIRTLFSGDTVIHHEDWGEQALAFTWIRLAGRIKAQQPQVPLYWLLIVKGHRTYRYLRAFSRSYWPSPQHPDHHPDLMDRLARQRFGDHYDPAGGLVRFPRSRGQLKPEWATPEPAELRRPEVRYFLERNPGYTRGDELVCLTELTPDNLRPLARRLFLQGMAG